MNLQRLNDYKQIREYLKQIEKAKVKKKGKKK